MDSGQRRAIIWVGVITGVVVLGIAFFCVVPGFFRAKERSEVPGAIPTVVPTTVDISGVSGGQAPAATEVAKPHPQGTPPAGTPEPKVIVPAPKDCIGYDPAKLVARDGGASGWQLYDGSHVLTLLDTKADAEDAVKVARRYRHMCYVGRDNQRSNRYLYIKTYWEVPSGLPLGLAPTLDCAKYDPGKLTVKPAGDSGWQLLAGGDALLLLDTAEDAQRALMVASDHSRLCLIGRDNDRPNHDRYVLEYWL